MSGVRPQPLFLGEGRAVEAAGGRVDKFLGDGVMALFGIESGAQVGCRQALAAARLMSQRLGELNLSLRDELDQPLRIGIGIHCGPVIVGEMGYGNTVSITAIGDAVNTASRLEELTKTYDVRAASCRRRSWNAPVSIYPVSRTTRSRSAAGGRCSSVRRLERAADLPSPDAAPVRHSEPVAAG